jgi:hypothetical protein
MPRISHLKLGHGATAKEAHTLGIAASQRRQMRSGSGATAGPRSGIASDGEPAAVRPSHLKRGSSGSKG